MSLLSMNRHGSFQHEWWTGSFQHERYEFLNMKGQDLLNMNGHGNQSRVLST